jgi:mitogen-activated protein kinase organizer 1
VVITGGYDATVRIWDVKSQNTKPIQILDEACDSVTCVGVSGWEIVAAGVDGRVRVYDLRMGMLRVDVVGCMSFPCLRVAPGRKWANVCCIDPITSLKLTKDSTAMLMSTLPPSKPEGAPAKILLMDKATGTLMQTYTGHTNSSYRIRSTLAMNDKYVLSGSEDGTVVIWELLTGNVVARVKSSSKGRFVSSIAFCERRKEWASAGGEGTVTVWGE